MGYGSQALALKYIGKDFEHWKICEWAVKSIQAYKDIHFTDDKNDYSKDLNKNQLQEFLFSKGISQNYNEPMTREQINRLNEKQLRTIYNNIQATHNLVNIQQVKGKDLEIVDTDKYDYIMTYSFPCQDLSTAGKGKGMSDTSTRSGMLWEVERILSECKELNALPRVLLMENVIQVHGADNTEDFNKWQLRLEELGYKNYWQDLIATDYGIPQTRNRCFMVSILGEYNYTFPKPIPLKLKLKDMLENNVNEKYFLSDNIQNKIMRVYEDENIDTGIDLCDTKSRSRDTSSTIKTSYGSFEHFYPGSTGIVEKKEIDEKYYLSDKAVDYICGNALNKDLKDHIDRSKTKLNKDPAYTITTKQNRRCGDTNYILDDYDEITIEDFLKIKNNTKKGYLEAEEGDGIDIYGRMEHHRGTVQKEKTQTITTAGGENNGVVVNMRNELCNNLVENELVEENDIIKINFTTEVMNGNKDYKMNNNISPTLTTASNNEIAVAINEEVEKIGSIYDGEKANSQGGSIYNKEKSSPTLSTGHGYGVPFIDEENMYSESEKQLFTEDGNIKRYMDSDIIDKFEEGQMATTTYPNGYGHGPRTHDYSIALNTIDKPSVKHNLRIRKLTPRECFRLMGVKDEDYDKVKKNQSDSSLYHLAGDSIVCQGVLTSIFREML